MQYYLTKSLNRSKPSHGLIHNVLFTTVSVLMFIFKFIVVILVYIKLFLSLFTFFEDLLKYFRFLFIIQI